MRHQDRRLAAGRLGRTADRAHRGRQPDPARAGGARGGSDRDLQRGVLWRCAFGSADGRDRALTCTGELATLNLRHQIPVFLIVSQRGTIDDHRIYQEVQGRRTLPLLQAYDFPYHIVDRPDDVSSIPDAFETCRMQKRPFVLFLTRRLVKGEGTA